MQNELKMTSAPPGSMHPVVRRAVAISIRQPWAWLILHGGKDIENRSWPTKFRGRVLIHASKGMTLEEWEDGWSMAFDIDERIADALPTHEQMQRGGIVGECEIVDCVTHSNSPWFVGQYGFVLRNAKPLPFQPCKGALGFFEASTSNAEISEDAGRKE